MARLYDMVQMTVASIATGGTGTLTLNAAAVVDGITYLTLAAGGAVNGDTVSYRIRDSANWEIGRGVVGGSGTTLTRGPLKSSAGGSAIIATTAALVMIVPLAEDFLTEDSTSLAVTAGTGTTQGTATQLVSEFNVITGGTVTGGAVALRQGGLRRLCIIRNSWTSPISVFPRAGDSAQINNNGTDALGGIIQPNSMLRFEAVSLTQWYV